MQLGEKGAGKEVPFFQLIFDDEDAIQVKTRNQKKWQQKIEKKKMNQIFKYIF